MNSIFSDSAAPATAEQVTRDANLIARNFAWMGREAAAASTASHIARFWAPLLRQTALEQVRMHPERFSAIAREALARLSAHGPRDAGQTR